MCNLIQWFEKAKLLIPNGLYFPLLAHLPPLKKGRNERARRMVKGFMLISARFLDMVGVGGSSPLGCTNFKGLQANPLKTVTYPYPIRNLIQLPKNHLFYVPYLNRKDKNPRPAVSRAVYVVNLCRGLFQTEVTTKTAQEPPKNSKVIYE
jgi:hypothetical protein